MNTLPRWIMTVIDPFAQTFGGIETWYRAQDMVVGALLTTGKRTVSAVLRALGRAEETGYARYHNVLNRAGVLHEHARDGNSLLPAGQLIGSSVV